MTSILTCFFFNTQIQMFWNDLLDQCKWKCSQFNKCTKIMFLLCYIYHRCRLFNIKSGRFFGGILTIRNEAIIASDNSKFGNTGWSEISNLWVKIWIRKRDFIFSYCFFAKRLNNSLNWPLIGILCLIRSYFIESSVDVVTHAII